MAIGSVSGVNTADLIKLNFNSKGGKTLTSTQKEELSEKYDTENMTQHQALQLEGDLTDYGVLSSADFLHALTEATSPLMHALINSDPTSGATVVQDYVTTSYTQRRDWVDYYKNAQADAEKHNKAAEASFDARLYGTFSELA